MLIHQLIFVNSEILRVYIKKRSGEITQFTGISDPYEAPEIMDIHIQTEKVTAKEAAEEIYLELQKRAIFK